MSDQWLGGYHLIRRLGTGGAGTVWLAEDGAGQRVALKLLHPALAASEAARVRLTREATTVNAVHSSGVAHVVDVETDDAQPFVVSEFIEGPTLATRLRSGALPPRELAALADALRHILDAVHAVHVVHRDVKPSNVILSATGPVLIDFGIAMGPDDEHLTGTGLVSGTAGFAAPELLRGGQSSDTTDWWAWAATVLNAATGRAPFGAGNAQAVSSRVLAEDPDVEGLPPGAADLFTQALRVDAGRRPLPSLVCERLTDHGLWSAAARAGRTTVLPTGDEGAGAPSEGDEDDATAVLAGDGDRARTLRDDAGFGVPVTGATELLGTPPLAPTAALPTDAGAAPPPVRTGAPDPPWSPGVRVLPGFSSDPPAPQDGAQPTPTQVWQRPDAQVPGSMDPGLPPWAVLGYRAARPRGVPVVGVFVMAALAALPVVLGSTGLVAVVVVLVLLSCLGYGRSWRERRRVRHAGARSSDTPLAIAALPLHLVTSVLALAVGALIGTAVSVGAWSAVWGLYPDSPGFTWPLEVLGEPRADLTTGTWITDPWWQAVLWAVVWVGLLLMWALPTSSGARDGLAIVVRSTLAPTWSRILACVIIGLVVGATWVITTGGPF